MTGPMVVRDVEVGGRRVDVRVEGGRVVAVDVGLVAGGARVVAGGGGALLPGLHDHHAHLLATAAAAASVRVGPDDVDGPGGLAAALRAATDRARPGEWARAVGYHESVAGDLDRWALDAAVGDRPVRVQHRSGALWVLSSAALASVGPLHPAPSEAGAAGRPPAGAGVGVDPHGVERDAAGEPTGRFFRADAWLARRWPELALDLAALGRRLLAHGVTGVTDATPFATADGPERLGRAVAAGELPQHVVVTGGPALAADEPPAGLGRGPVKVLLADHDLPPLGLVAAWARDAHAAGRPVAVHCVTAEALVIAVTAIAEAGPHPGDRIEHGAVVPAALLADVADVGVTVVTQPNFVAERGDAYLRDVEPHERPDLWRCASLRAAGIPVAGGTDAPYGDPDPWRAIAAAVDRRTGSGATLGGDEALPPADALALFLGAPDAPGGPPRRVAPGAAADLCLLHVPLAEALAAPSSALVREAFVA